MSALIETRDLRRAFGALRAVDGLSLRVEPGSIYGFLGPNGAGKTTTIRILAGLLWPDYGTVRVNGVDPCDFSAADRRDVGYVSEKQTLPPEARVDRLIAFCAGLYPGWDDALAARLLDRFAIDPTTRVKRLSQGAMRKLSVLLALSHRPKLLLLDEPAAGLDVAARRELLEELLEVVRDGDRSVFFSSHLLSDVERVADRVGIVMRGRLILSEPLDDLKESVKQVRFYEFPGAARLEVPDAIRILHSRDEALVTMRVRGDEIERLAARHGCRYEVHALSLEDIFVELTREPEARRVS
jgi:ABC-2 type transport system ATP-binding protein